MNATGKAGRQYSAEELRAMARDARDAGKPDWIARALEEQADAQYTPQPNVQFAHQPGVIEYLEALEAEEKKS